MVCAGFDEAQKRELIVGTRDARPNEASASLKSMAAKRQGFP